MHGQIFTSQVWVTADHLTFHLDPGMSIQALVNFPNADAQMRRDPLSPKQPPDRQRFGQAAHFKPLKTVIDETNICAKLQSLVQVFSRVGLCFWNGLDLLKNIALHGG